jgi:hypothetical protein
MSKFELIKERLSNRFAKLNDILEIELREDFSIIDHKGQSFIIVSINFEGDTFTVKKNGKEIIERDFDSAKLFNIKNSKIIGFIPIDGKKGLLGFGTSHCDFVFFDENEFCFVEFKLNATSLNNNAVSKNRLKAIDQLKNTIALFNYKLDKNYSGLLREAYVCTPETYPRGDQGWRDLAIAFYDEVEIPLFEHNQKICG